MARSVIRLPFPAKGLDENASYRDQPEKSTPDCLNVRPYDPIGGRVRGGPRAGTAKTLPDPINADNAVQLIRQVTLPLVPQQVNLSTIVDEAGGSGFTDDFAYADGYARTVAAANWDFYRYSGAWSSNDTGTGRNYFNSTSFSTGNEFGWVVGGKVHGASYGTGWLWKGANSLGTIYGVSFRTRMKEVNSDPYHRGNITGIVLRANKPDPTTGDYYVIEARRGAATKAGRTEIAVVRYDAGVRTIQTTAVITTPPTAYRWSDYFTLEARVNENFVFVYVNGNLVHADIMASYGNQSGVGLAHRNSGGSGSYILIDQFKIMTGALGSISRDTRLVLVSGGSIYQTDSNDQLVLATNGAGALSQTTIDITGQEAPASPNDAFPTRRFVYFCDGVNYKRVNVNEQIVESWTAFNGTDVVNNETIDGSLPVGTEGESCKFVTIYRGRLVLWGLRTDPQNWFMSAVMDPRNWDYSPPTARATQAVAGNASDAGKLGDILLACCPYSDDNMILGGDHTLWIMRGDPAAGGGIDSISYQTGIVGAEAFARDEAGNLYFFGSNGIYRVAGGDAQPELITSGRLDRRFSSVDLAVNRIRLLWNSRLQGLHVFITPLTQGTSTHYYWDRRTDSWWVDRFPDATGPTAVWMYDADDPNDRLLMLGGFDSYVRSFDEAGKSDDGGAGDPIAITSYVLFPPIVASDWVRMRLESLQASLDRSSDPITMQVLSGRNAESAIESTAVRFSATLQPGRGQWLRQRVADNAITFKLLNATVNRSWALDSMCAIFTEAGMQRQHGRAV